MVLFVRAGNDVGKGSGKARCIEVDGVCMFRRDRDCCALGRDERSGK